MERYGYIAVHMDDVFRQCLEWDVIALELIRMRCSYRSECSFIMNYLFIKSSYCYYK
jgi:hypothetical protein